MQRLHNYAEGAVGFKNHGRDDLLLANSGHADGGEQLAMGHAGFVSNVAGPIRR